MNIEACDVKTSAEAEKVRKYVKMCSRKGAKAYVHSFGCQLNVSDGEKMKGILDSLGFSFTDKYEEADLILLNTCAVRESAEDTVYGTLGNMKKYKKQPMQLHRYTLCFRTKATICRNIPYDYGDPGQEAHSHRGFYTCLPFKIVIA